MERTYDTDQFAKLVKQAYCAIAQSSFRYPQEDLKVDSKLRWIQMATAGVNQIWTPELRAANHVSITSCKDPMGSLSAEPSVTLMLALARNLRGFMKSHAYRFWSRQDYGVPFMSQILGKTIAILDVGSFGGTLPAFVRSDLA